MPDFVQLFTRHAFAAIALTMVLGDWNSAALAIDVELTDLTGKAQQGELISVDDEAVSVSIASTPLGFELSNILKLQFLNAQNLPVKATSANDSIELRLSDGSTLNASDIAGQNDQWQISGFDPLANITLPNNAIVSAKLKSLPSSAFESWNQAIDSERTYDSLAILRDDQLDFLNGAILSIDDSAIAFEFDGQTIPAPRAKVVGAIWFRRESRTVRSAPTLVLKNDSRLLCKAIQCKSSSADGGFTIETLGGLKMELASDQVAMIDYASANMRWLDQVEVLESSCVDMLGVTDKLPIRRSLLAPRFVEADQPNASSSSKLPSKNLTFNVPGRIVLRVPEGYRQLETTIQRNKEASLLAPIQIKIAVDGKIVWEKELSGDTMKVEVKVDVEANKRLEIAVDSKSQFHVGTQTTFAQPRLLR